jgi:hypothetical protein
MIARDTDIRFPFRLRVHNADVLLDVRLRDVHPELTAIVRLRIDTWVGRLLGIVLDRLQIDARQKLDASPPS